MKVRVEFNHNQAQTDFGRLFSTVVVIDTLRATSTITHALAVGANQVIPVRTPDEARSIRLQSDVKQIVLCGEKDARMISGFDLGNSPLEYTPDAVHDKTLVLCTTNGTGALLACTGVELVVCGCLNNVNAVVESIRIHASGDVLLLCAGTNGRFSMEDSITAGAIVARLRLVDASIELTDDAAIAAGALFEYSRADLATVVANSEHGRYLASIGLAEDLRVCAQLNSHSVVPVYRDFSVRLS